MSQLFIALLCIALYGCNKAPKTDSASTIDTISTEPERPYYTILEQTQPGNFKNYEILINSNNTQLDNVKQAVQMFVVAECTATPCNRVGIWSSEQAYKLYKAKTDQPTWRKQYWPYIAEHYVADYNATVNKLNLFPFLNSDYRRWGGTQQRPTPHSVDL